MLYGFVPKWLEKLERRMPWLAIPNIALYLVGLQVLGLLLVLSDPQAREVLVLDPHLVVKGEVWRLGSFLALPLSTSLLWTAFVLYFLYFIVNGIESEWGAFKTTFYILTSALLTIAFAFAFQVPITSVQHLELTLFLAAAAIAPDYEILLFFILPVKLKWLAWLTVAFIVWQFCLGSWLTKIYLLALYANYLLFFGPYHWWQLNQWIRRRKMRGQFRR